MNTGDPVQTGLSVKFGALLESVDIDLARAALVIAEIEYPGLDVEASLARLRELGDRARERIEAADAAPVRSRVRDINQVLFSEEGFAGNRTQYSDFRNSLLNVVLERRLGIPISLALVYMEVGRRAGLHMLGIAFPGHFLVRVPPDAGEEPAASLILDPFNGGRELDEDGCRDLLRRQLGAEAAFDRGWLEPCSSRQMLTRLLGNLKRLYVEQRSFRQAHQVCDLLLTLDPSGLFERRDRGLLSYHLDDCPAALRDLDEYLRRHAWTRRDKGERDQIERHVRALRLRVASMN